MGKIGLSYFAAAKIATEPDNALPTYDAGFVVGEAISAKLAIAYASGQQYADDRLSDDLQEFANGDLTCEAADIALEKQATLYGESVDADEVGDHSSDEPPAIGFGYVQTLRVKDTVTGRKKRIYRTAFYPKGKASVPADDAQTKAGSFTIGNTPLNLKIFEPNWGKWRYRKNHDTFAAAKAYIDTKLGIATWYRVSVQVQGASSGESVSPAGDSYVAANGNLEIIITGTPTALYDNGVESSASIAGGKYTITATAADHTISVIF